jgi:hypothetical protein
MAKRRSARRNGMEWNEKRVLQEDPNTRKTETAVPVDQSGVDLGKGFNPPLLRSGDWESEAGEAIGVEAEKRKA